MSTIPASQIKAAYAYINSHDHLTKFEMVEHDYVYLSFVHPKFLALEKQTYLCTFSGISFYATETTLDCKLESFKSHLDKYNINFVRTHEDNNKVYIFNFETKPDKAKFGDVLVAIGKKQIS